MFLENIPTIRCSRGTLFFISVFLVVFYFYFTRPDSSDT